MKNLSRLILVVAGAVLPARVILAHHSTAMFDMQKEVTVEGVVKEFQWTNPHTFILLNIPTAAGGGDQYQVEGMSPNYLARNGWTKTTIRPGDKVVLVIHPFKDGRPGGFDVSLRLTDGRLLYNLPHFTPPPGTTGAPH